ncbi:MAG: carboxymuconolactone decarboxylase family protein [Beijerinckiaceae bacterium]|nr:carboxymuconolactone decarboxylase family protein [Beijerinckiaceae bacterium]
MSRIPLLSIDIAPSDAKPRLAAAEAANGYLPNLLGLLANAPSALEAYLTLSGINAKAGLTLAERETVQITAAATHGCGFCVAGHTAIALKKAGLPAPEVEALRSVAALSDARLDAVQSFTTAVIRSRGAVSDEELAAFKTAGFSDANALEVVLGVGLATICNFANNLGQPELNAQLEPYRWERPASLAAE